MTRPLNLVWPLLFALSCAGACGEGQPVTPAPGYPCGVTGVVCIEGTSLTPTGMCCAEDFVCGGGFPNVGCPANYCCFVGPEGPPSQFAARKPVPQTPWRRP
jgi:hypothetical protein